MRPPQEHRSNFDTNGNDRSCNTEKSQDNSSAVLAFDSEYDYQPKVVIFLNLIRLSHFESSLRPSR